MPYSYPPVEIDKGLEFTKSTHHDTYPAIDPTTQSDLTGRNVFITGASKGVGRATAISFAKAGASGIAIGARSDLSDVESEIYSAAKSACRQPPQVLKFHLDIMDHTSVKETAGRIEAEFGRLDILINNAGYLSTFQPVAETDPAEWWMNWQMNINGTYLVTKELLPLLLRGGDKTILNITSIGAHGLRNGASGYQTSKFALLRFTEYICTEYAEQDILSYCVHPGGVNTEMGRRMPSAAWKLLIDQPELAGDTLVSLASKRREWLAGRYVSVTWDMPELYRRENEIIKEDKLKMRMKF